MGIDKYRILKDAFSLTENELQVFLLNYYDSFTFNRYLQNNTSYIRLEFDSLDKLINYFEENEIDEKTRKRIVISMPMIFSCDDFDEQLSIVYKDSNLEGIIIKDRDDIKHPYRIKKHPRSITENMSMLQDLVSDVDSDYKKTYYTKVREGKLRNR